MSKDPGTGTGNSMTNQLAVRQVADWSICGLDDSQTSQLAKMSGVKCGENNCYLNVIKNIRCWQKSSSPPADKYLS